MPEQHDRYELRKIQYKCEHVGEVRIPISREAQTRALRGIERIQKCPQCRDFDIINKAKGPAKRNRARKLPELNGTPRQIPRIEIIRDRAIQDVSEAIEATKLGIWAFQAKRDYTQAAKGENALGALYWLLRRYSRAKSCVEWYGYRTEHGHPRHMIEIAYDRLPGTLKARKSKWKKQKNI